MPRLPKPAHPEPLDRLALAAAKLRIYPVHSVDTRGATITYCKQAIALVSFAKGEQ